MVQWYTVTNDGRYVHYCAECRRWWTCGTACFETTDQVCPWCAGDGEELPGVELLESPTRATLALGGNYIRALYDGAPAAV